MRTRRIGSWVACFGLACLLASALGSGCKNTTAPGEFPPPPPPLPRPFNIWEIALRPHAIERPTRIGSSPTPAIPDYAVTALYQGGLDSAQFAWTYPTPIGTLVPKGPGLTLHNATVQLHIRDDGHPPLGLFEIKVVGHSLNEYDSVTTRFAVVEYTWMKHQRITYSSPQPPEDLVRAPVFWQHGSRTDILFVTAPGPTTIKLARIRAFWETEVASSDVIVNPPPPDPNVRYNIDFAPKVSPDPAPAASGLRDILFASQMDTVLPALRGRQRPPYNIWWVKFPDDLPPEQAFPPRQLTFDEFAPDSTLYGWDYTQPRWDPNSTPGHVRIAFVSDRKSSENPQGLKVLWTGEVLDRNGNGHADSLVIGHPLPGTAGIQSYDWDPNPDHDRVCFADGAGLHWVHVASGEVTSITMPDSAAVVKLSFPSVYWKPGEHELIAFQAAQSQLENLSSLYVLDTADQKLARVLPFPYAVTHHLFPRWHPTKKWIVYVNDYWVRKWSDVDDQLAPGRVEDQGMPRTKFPSPWVVKLED